MKTVALLFYFILLSFSCFSQSFSNDGSERDEIFFYKVKQIDEFIERFNNDKNAYIRRVYKQKNLPFKISRAALIKSLFNYGGTAWDNSLQQTFIKDVDRKKSPRLLDLSNKGVYAEVLCNFRYYKSVIRIPLIMQMQGSKDEGFKWIILSANASSLKKEPTSNFKFLNTGVKFINPTSEGIDFSNLWKVFGDKSDLTDYFDSDFINTVSFQSLSSCIINNHLEFINVESINYHFFNVNNWIFVVKNYERKSLNSGWLIDKLIKTSEAEKNQFKDKLFNTKS